ncbi:MAG: toll/interleukin-1 receptor domain-containing protein [Flavobacteriales bacterium]|nr:toll/interleukin-1 receptor domain-containing protein [Flavobacteriales bacterium]
MATKTKLFISHSNDDKNKLETLLRVFNTPGSHFEAVAIIKNRNPGVLFSDKVKSGIDDCKNLIAIISKNSIHSQWVNQEIGYFLGSKSGVIPYVIIDRNIRSSIKGFVHSEMDLPFSYLSDTNKFKEGHSFRKACVDLYEFLQESIPSKGVTQFESEILPKRIASGDIYHTKIRFRGSVVNGFFDNRVIHQESNFRRWQPDPHTFIRKPNQPSATTPGVLNGFVEDEFEYSHHTQGWPKGVYTIRVCLYSHVTPGKEGRQLIYKNNHQLIIL